MLHLSHAPYLSVIIKALNEEGKIAAAIRSAINATLDIDAEIILADAHSDDDTIKIASAFPIRIIKMKNTADRGCGATAQMGWQAARGKYILIMDGDMELEENFPKIALDFLERNSDCAGVKGEVEEMSSSNFEFRRRKEKTTNFDASKPLLALEGGGLYRKSAIEQVGYFGDKNLKSFEELDLGLRLRNAKWKLAELPTPAVRHYSHNIGDIEILRLRASSGYIVGIGQLIRAHPDKLLNLIRHLNVLKLILGAILYFIIVTAIATVSAGFVKAGIIAVGAILPISAYWLRKRELREALLSLTALLTYIYGFIKGILMPRKNPHSIIDFEELNMNYNMKETFQ